ncbi:MAG: hypothetical protein IPJ38_19705 [Dechloromonas sp.]|uniref:Uncharacterized protein n=1 Tax=Candidatus Dechloromonas phosphorivorans TaxID=2899244 RepID=A0A935MZQ8_9RHOO|nr:hypothetical protein [Candidatus Dechloromonas phosphorivorans]
MQIANNSAIRLSPRSDAFQVIDTAPCCFNIFLSEIYRQSGIVTTAPLTLPNKQISIIGRRYYYFDQWIQAQKSILNEPS